VARSRIQKKLDSADRYAESHFDGPSLYQSEIERNMDFLRETIETADLNRLRRYCYSMSSPARPRHAVVASGHLLGTANRGKSSGCPHLNDCWPIASWRAPRSAPAASPSPSSTTRQRAGR